MNQVEVDMIKAQQKEIEELRKALEFYADHESYNRVCIERSTFEQYQPSVYAKQPVLDDAGARARTALGGKS